MRHDTRRAIFVSAIASIAACIASAPEGLHRRSDGSGGGGGGVVLGQQASVSASVGSGPIDPHAVLGATPPHGPFTGGNQVIVAGNGFAANVRVWFGQTEATGAVAINPSKVQVSAPAHAPGGVDLSAQDGDDASTRRTLAGAYTYDALYADPGSGPVAGGTVITFRGSGNHWDTQAAVEADIDGKPCTTTAVLGPDTLSCTAPKGTPGSKSISVVTKSSTVQAFDAYTYQDSSNGFKGGLSGKALNGQLTVLVFDNFTGDAISGAHAIAGADLATAVEKDTDDSGVAVLKSPALAAPVTVTVAAFCHAPISFVNEPVDTVTVYLDPTLTPACAGMGDPPPVAGKPEYAGFVQGQLVWPSEKEFEKGGWFNVPQALAGEERVAFVQFATSDRRRAWQQPSDADAVTEQSPGDIGYGFKVAGPPGYQAMYAVAGIRNKQTQQFTAYAFGAIKGVAVLPEETTSNVVIEMSHALDQKLVVAPDPPAPDAKGPDRFHAKVDIEIAQGFYALLPNADKTPLLPLAAPVPFVGMPGLDGDLTGDRYLALAEAATGPQLGAPLSTVRSVAATSTAAPLTVDGFVRIPVLGTPQQGTAFDGRHLAVSYPKSGFPADLTVYEVLATGSYWLVVVPQADNSVTLPDISGYPQAGLPPGALTIRVYGGRYDKFDYGSLTYRQLQPSGMAAYAQDDFNSFL